MLRVPIYTVHFLLWKLCSVCLICCLTMYVNRETVKYKSLFFWVSGYWIGIIVSVPLENKLLQKLTGAFFLVCSLLLTAAERNVFWPSLSLPLAVCFSYQLPHKYFHVAGTAYMSHALLRTLSEMRCLIVICSKKEAASRRLEESLRLGLKTQLFP